MDTEAKKNIVMDLVSKLGFPVVVCGWLLYERATTLGQLTSTIAENSELIKRLTDMIQTMQ
jgi:hypothetical protein